MTFQGGDDDKSPEMVAGKLYYISSLRWALTCMCVYVALRTEWAKCKSRAARYHEEVEWLYEEMRRVLQFCDTKEQWWRDRIGMRVEGDEALMEGLRAYALEHASDEHNFKEMLEGKWAGIRRRAEIVLKDLASPVFSETPTTEPVIVDVNFDFGDDTSGGICDEPNDEDEEHEEEEPIA